MVSPVEFCSESSVTLLWGQFARVLFGFLAKWFGGWSCFLQIRNFLSVVVWMGWLCAIVLWSSGGGNSGKLSLNSGSRYLLSLLAYVSVSAVASAAAATADASPFFFFFSLRKSGTLCYYYSIDDVRCDEDRLTFLLGIGWMCCWCVFPRPGVIWQRCLWPLRLEREFLLTLIWVA